MIEELQLIFTKKDKSMTDKLGCTQNREYIKALVELVQWHQRMIVNFIYGMLEFEP